MKKTMIALLLLFASLGASAQQIEAKQSVIDCGQIMFQKPVTVEFELQSKGSRDLVIDDVKTSCGCTMISFPKNNIAKGESFKLKVTYDAKQMGHFEKQIGIYSNASKKPLMLTLRGIVVDEIVDFSGDYPYKIGDLRTDINDIEFDDVNSGDRPFQKIHVYNATSKTVEPQVMHLPNYLKAQVSPSKIAPQHSGVITLLLDSKMLRDFGLTQTSVFLGMYPGDKVSSEKEITVSTVLLPDFDNINEQALAYAPKLKLSAKELNFDFEGKSKDKQEIDVINEGRTTLEIRSLQMFTEGLEVSLSNKRIQPGEKAKLKVAANVKDLKKTRSKPRILMITNDPHNAKVVITVNVK
jgi:hypothetical protein